MAASAQTTSIESSFIARKEKRNKTMRSKNTAWAIAIIVTALLSVAVIGSTHLPTEKGRFSLSPEVADRNGPFQ
jgi:hypothetical protein